MNLFQNVKFVIQKNYPFYSFGYHPTVNDFALTNSFNPKVNYFPLDLILCKNCDLIQLNIIINSKTIFPDNYAYRSGTTKILIENFKNLKECFKKIYYIKKI